MLAELFTKHIFDKVFPLPQFTFNHNSLSYYCWQYTKTASPDEAGSDNCCDGCYQNAARPVLTIFNLALFKCDIKQAFESLMILYDY
ncbi:hypothetical protein CRX51_11760 [Pluralibacter gergoviae]|nr:hypothetical protein CRX51_11760 [Pluralibacter gergoviae]